MATHPDYSTIEGAYRRGYLQAIEDALRALDKIEDAPEMMRMSPWDALRHVEADIEALKARLTPA